jgi:hypothetical protein
MALAGYGAVPVIAYQDRTLLLKKLSSAPLPQNIKLPTIEERFSLLDKAWPIPRDYQLLARQFRDHIFNA